MPVAWLRAVSVTAAGGMAEAPPGRRPARRCAAGHRAGRTLPSAVHYLGYVEEDETPEMIMKKFEELDKVAPDFHCSCASCIRCRTSLLEHRP